MSRCWSSSDSVFFVTFSVADTVSPATSLRISWIARRVSCSMSRRACSMSSSRLCLPSTTACCSVFSAALLARAMMSSDWSRASRSRARYSSRILSASRRVSSAASIDSSIACWRLSSASWILGNASRFRSHSEIPNARSVQIMSPTPGWTRKLPDEARRAVIVFALAAREEERDQTEDEGVEHDRLGEREAQPLDRRDLVPHLGLAGHRLDDLAEDVADADARADGAEAGADAEGDAGQALCRALGHEVGDEREVHVRRSFSGSGRSR